MKKSIAKATLVVLCGVLVMVCSINIYGKTKGIPDDGLVAYWNFDEGKGDVAKDISGKKHDMEFEGIEWVKGSKGTGVYFTGNEYGEVQSTKDLELTGAVSLVMWIKADSVKNSAWQDLLVKWGPEGKDGYGLYLNIDDGILYFRGGFADSSSTHDDPGSGWTAWDEEWHHIAVVFDGKEKTMTFYVDGEEVNSTNIGFSEMRTANDVLVVGKYYPGIMDEFLIYNRAISADEINSIKKATKAK